MTLDERDGGDPPCWAHLFEDEGSEQQPAPASPDRSAGLVAVADLPAWANAAALDGAAWAHQSADLNVNLLVFAAGAGVAAHVNAEIDVLLVGVAGEGVVEIDEVAFPLGAGRAIVVPKGSRRATRAGSDRFAYLSCHRRRGGLLPSR